MRERVHRFGTDNCLVGVVAEPHPKPVNKTLPAVLLGNVGLNHRVGPYRLWVDVARELAQKGFIVLRFDFSGLGDSEMRKDTRSDLERAVVDMTEAMDFVQAKWGIQTFVPIALCSGVDSAHSIGISDKRVVGAGFLDGYAYTTPQFYLRRLMQKYSTRERWRVYVHRNWLPRIGTKGGPREAGEAPEIFVREYPEREQFARDVDAMVKRGVKLLFVYSGGVEYHFNAPRQFFEMAPIRSKKSEIQVEFFKEADHVYSIVSDRARLVRRLVDWMLGHFPPERPTPSVTSRG